MKQTTTITQLGVIHAIQQINNPLTNILLSVEELLTELKEPRNLGYCNTIKENSLRIKKSIDEVCAFFNEQATDASSEESFIRKKKL